LSITHVALADVLALEKLEIGAVAVEHERPLQTRRQHLAARRVALDDADAAGGRLLEPLGELDANVAAADDGDLDVAAVPGRVHHPLDVPRRLRRAHDDDLVVGLQLGGAARHEQRAAAFDRDQQRAARQVQLAERLADQRRRRVEPVLEQPDAAARENLRVDGAGRGDDALDVGGELRLGPQHPIDAELAQPEVLAAFGQEVGPRHHADRLRVRHPVGNRARHDVHFVERGAGDEEPRVLDARPLQRLLAGAAGDDQLSVDVGEGVGDVGVVIDHDHFVIGSEGTRQRRPNLPAPDNDDPHVPFNLPYSRTSRATETRRHGASSSGRQRWSAALALRQRSGCSVLVSVPSFLGGPILPLCGTT
jgi:hypothetical protein